MSARWDCIAVDDEPVAEPLFREVERAVLRRNAVGSICASEFELLAATAFEVFTRRAVEVGVVEVGMGGRLDATNVLESPAVTVIAKVGLDHQAFLGSTLREIAREKAGIMKSGVPCIIDGSNAPVVLETLKTVAEEVDAGALTFCDPLQADHLSAHPISLPPHEAMNLSCAYHAVSTIIPETEASHALNAVLDSRAAGRPLLPGRLHLLSISALTPRKAPVLLDGAHNEDAARILAAHVRALSNSESCPVTWVLALTAGRDPATVLRPLLRDGDAVVAVEFEAVDGMPWVRPVEAKILLGSAKGMAKVSKAVDCGADVRGALEAAANVAEEGPLVVAGSLYLVSSVLRLLRDAGGKCG